MTDMEAGQTGIGQDSRYFAAPSRRHPNGRPLCGANTRAEGSSPTCRKGAGEQTSHPGIGRCKWHGGTTPDHKTNARKIKAMNELEDARRQALSMGVPVRGVPVSMALMDEFAHIYGHCIWLRGKVQETEPDALIWGKVDEHHKMAGEFPGIDTKYAAQPNAWVQLYERFLRLLLDYGKNIETLKLDQTKLELIKELAERHAARIDRMAHVLQLTPEQWALMPRAVAAMEDDATVIEGEAA